MKTKQALFWLGCFWGVQKYFDQIPGVMGTEVWYAGGSTQNATYREIGDHSEVILIDYDPRLISYRQLLESFIQKRDPGFPSYKTQYDSLILYENDEEKKIAQDFFQEQAQKNNREINIRIEKRNLYFKAEEQHQKYYQKRYDSI